MEKVNYTNARAQLSRLMDQVLHGFPVEITRKDREPVIIISKTSYEAYKKAEFYNRFPQKIPKAF
jgi:antitoxin Phd